MPTTQKAAAGQRRPLRQEALYIAPATQKAAAGQLLEEALYTVPATQKAARKLSVLRLPAWGSE